MSCPSLGKGKPPEHPWDVQGLIPVTPGLRVGVPVSREETLKAYTLPHPRPFGGCLPS